MNPRERIRYEGGGMWAAEWADRRWTWYRLGVYPSFDAALSALVESRK